MSTPFSPEASSIDPAAFWESRARRVRRVVNAAWFFDQVRPLLFLASVIVTATILLGRRLQWRADWLYMAVGILLLAAIATAFWRARVHFISSAAARTEIESTLKLHSRLSSAAEGVGSWPETSRWKPSLWRWRWQNIVVLPLCSLALVITAFLLPIVVAPAVHPPPIVKPPAMEQIDQMLEQLAATPQLNQDSIDALREEAEQLAKQDPADWYSHASLEAADHLKAKILAGVNSLNDKATKLQNLLGQNPAEAGATWHEQLQNALTALQGNTPNLSHELTEALAALDPSKFQALTAEQVERLKEQLKAARRRLGHGDGEETQDGENNPGGGNGGQGEGTEEGEGEGGGGVSRGPGTAPVKLGAKPTDLNTKELEGVQNDDFRRATMGDTLGTSAGQHDVDKAADHRSASGGAAAVGDGANATWRQQNVTPVERKRLEAFFK